MSVAASNLDHMAASAIGGWVRPAPGRPGLRADTGLAALLAIASLTSALLYLRTGIFDESGVAAPWVWALGIGVATLPLALRRRYPVPAAAAVTAGFTVCGIYSVPDLLVTPIALFIALYTVGAWESRRGLAFWGRLGITVAMLVWVSVNLLLAVDGSAFPDYPRSGIFSAYATFAVIQIMTNLAYFSGAFFFGERSWHAARNLALLEAQGRELDLERQTSAAQAVALDRLEIARELHDLVAHHVSVMGIQAAAARRSIETDPERAKQALAAVEDGARNAVDELRRLVHTLRTPAADGSETTVGIAQLPALVAESQSAGVPTTLIVAGDPRPLPMLVDVALYRIAQEALTNVRKHAGKGARAEVRLRFASDAVEVEVSDDGVVQSAGGAGAGVGLRGMRERIGAVGGRVHTERRDTAALSKTGGFLVRATVPTPLSPDESIPTAEPVLTAPEEASP